MIDQKQDGPEAVMRMTYPRLYASPDGETHFQDAPGSMTPVVYTPGVPGAPLVDVAPAQPVAALPVRGSRPALTRTGTMRRGASSSWFCQASSS
jgi:hypothetical protein